MVNFKIINIFEKIVKINEELKLEVKIMEYVKDIGKII